MWPFSIQSTSDNASGRTMRLYVKNVAYGSLLFLAALLLRTSVLISKSSSSNADLSEDLSQSEHPRFRRSLEFASGADYSAQHGPLPREGPLVDLGTQVPEKWGNDVFISVKTSHKYHESRLQNILDTWFRLSPENIYFFSDKNDQQLDSHTGGHLVNTKCSSSHSRQSLCCKMGKELDHYMESGKKWFCHFDDDNYVNVPELMRMLSLHDPRKDWYLGRPSTRGPIEIMDKENAPQTISFWFATGGAGFCLSRSLALKMAPFASQGKFIDLGEKIRLPDDVTLGYLVEHLLQKKLTVIEKFHSHLESMKNIDINSLHEQVSLSFGSYDRAKNVVPVKGSFSDKDDPSKFKSIHCHLFPKAYICPATTTMQ